MVRIIQAGMGGWGRDWAKYVIGQDDQVELVGCVDADLASLALARKELNLPPRKLFQTLEEAQAAVDAEAVLITANLPGHVPLAMEALRAGKHVLLEKPFAPSLAEAREVVELAEQIGVVLMISQNYRFFPAVQMVRDLVRAGDPSASSGQTPSFASSGPGSGPGSGQVPSPSQAQGSGSLALGQGLGVVGSISLDFRRYANSEPREGHRHYALDQPLLADMAIHHFDLMRVVLGQEPVEVTCRAWNPPWSNFDGPAAAAATILFDGGTVVSYRGSWVSPGPQTTWAGDWRMECAGGEIAWTSRGDHDSAEDRVTVRPLGKRPRRLELPPIGPVDRAGSLRAFTRAVSTGQQPESSGRDNLRSLALMRAAIEAASTGKRVRVVSG